MPGQRHLSLPWAPGRVQIERLDAPIEPLDARIEPLDYHIERGCK